MSIDELLASIPLGYRAMTPAEGDALVWHSAVTLWDGVCLYVGVVDGVTDEHTLVKLRSQHIVALDRDEPDYWPEGEQRARRAPMDDTGEFVAVCA